MSLTLISWTAVLLAQVPPPEVFCGPDLEPVRVELLGSPAPESLWRDVHAHLLNSLEAQGYSRCEVEAQAPPLALKVLGAEGATAVSVSVTREGYVPLSRGLDVATLPEDSRALAIAISAEELLRAARNQPQWPRQPEPLPLPPPPQPVTRGLISLSLALDGEAFTEGHQQFGPELRAAYVLAERWSVQAAGGYRWSRVAPSPLGGFRSRGWSFFAGAGYGLQAREASRGVELEAGIATHVLTFQGPFSEPSETHAAIVPSLGVSGFFDVSASWRLVARVQGGWAARRVRVFDEDMAMPSVGGVQLGASLGATWGP